MGWFSRTQRHVSAVIDLESGSVAAAVLVTEAEGSSRIVASIRKDAPTDAASDAASSATLTPLIREASDAVLKVYAEHDAAKKYGPVRHVYAGLDLPSVVSETAVVHENNSGAGITDTLIKTLAGKAVAGMKGVGRVFETSVTRVLLNGYPTGKPRHKVARDISVMVFRGALDDPTLSAIEGALHASFPGRDIIFRSHTRVLQSVLHERANISNYVVLAMRSDSTSFTVVRKDELGETQMVGEGTRNILKRISGIGLSAETYTLLRMVAAGTCSTPACKELESALAKEEPELVKVFGGALSAIASSRRVPDALVLSVHSPLLPWLSKFFSRLDFAQFTNTLQPFTVELLSPDVFRDIVEWDRGLEEDPGIVVLAAYAHYTQRDA